MTEKEVEIFKEVLQKNGIQYRETPRTKDELANLICVFNKKTKMIDLLPKDCILTKDEVFIPIKGLCEDYTQSINLIESKEAKNNHVKSSPTAKGAKSKNLLEDDFELSM